MKILGPYAPDYEVKVIYDSLSLIFRIVFVDSKTKEKREIRIPVERVKDTPILGRDYEW